MVKRLKKAEFEVLMQKYIKKGYSRKEAYNIVKKEVDQMFFSPSTEVGLND